MRISDWSSDVCSSDLPVYRLGSDAGVGNGATRAAGLDRRAGGCRYALRAGAAGRCADGFAQPLHWLGRRRLAVRGFRCRHGAACRQLCLCCQDSVAGYSPNVFANAERAWDGGNRSEEHTSELQSLMRISYAVFFLKKKNKTNYTQNE